MSDYLGRVSQYSPKRLALLADELHSRVQELERVQGEPIAIVGIGCRLPGGVTTPEQFWKLARAGVDAIREVPPDRWDVNAVYDPDPDAPGKMSTRWGGFIESVDSFDAHFFGISPREAQSMDPQQRLLLEVTWEALEHAAISPQRLENTRTSVYVGVSGADYYQLIRSAGVANLDAYTASGVAHSIASGRLSYVLGVRGPSVTIDTACSSSLVAVHHAVGSLRRGESSMALAGGVNLVLGPDVTIALSKARMMAPDGRCKAFDARADGFVRGEGCGMLVLKRLSDAQADGDRIIALIRGSAANQDGRSNGLTAPNGPSQIDVLRDALANANVQPHEVGYVEAHGTGTSLGDPIEVQALGAVFGTARNDAPLLVGSVKANIGHLEAAAGVAGLIKLAMALKHGEVPGQIHLRQVNPHIAWDDMAVRVPTALTAWPAANEGRRIGGVSSFGFSGTNVHMVLEEAPSLPAVDHAGPEQPAHLVTLSARSDAALAALASAYAKHAEASDDGLADVAHTMNAGRAHFAHRAAFVARSKAEAVSVFERLANGMTDLAVTGVAPTRAPRVAFLFTGQGSQYANMARGLYETQPLFRAALEQCNELLRPHLPRPLLSVLFPPPGASSPIDDTEYTQPALFAVEYALAALWMSWGIRPVMVMGHSVGEVAAACIAGVFSLEDAVKLIASRGQLMGALPRHGGMVAVRATEAQVIDTIAPWQAEVGIAAINGPTNIVISGLQSRLQQITARLATAGIECTPLNVSHAFHSPLMQPMLAEFHRTLERIAFSMPRIDLVSNVTGRPIGSQVATAAYWADHVLSPVQFAPAVQAVAQAGCDVFLEIGPHPTLLGMARQCVNEDAIAWLPSLRKGRDDWAQILQGLAELYVRGADIDWRAFDSLYRRSRVDLPGYPFQRERYWVNAQRNPRAFEAARAQPMLHPLLGQEVLQSVSAARLFESRLDVSRLPYLEDHRIRDRLLLPSPAFMEMALAAGTQQFGTDRLQLEDFTVHQALSVEGEAPVVQLVLDAPVNRACDVRISSLDDSEQRWILHATARVRVGGEATARDSLDAIRARVSDVIDVEAYYAMLASLGLSFGPRFRASQTIARRDGEVLARMKAAPAIASDVGAYGQHPALLDACLHLIGAALPGAGMKLRNAFLLLNVEHIAVHRRPPDEFWAHVMVDVGGMKDPDQLETFNADLALLDDAGRPVAEFRGLRLKRARPDAAAGRISSGVRSMIHEIVWREAPPAGAQLPLPQNIASEVSLLLGDLAERNALDAYGNFLPALDVLASAYVVSGVQALGFRLAMGERFHGETLRKRLRVQDRYQRLFARMLAMLAEDGVLVADGGEWRVLREPTDVNAQTLGAELLARHPDCAAELNLTRRCAESLATVLKGETDPLSLLFPGGSLAETESLYQNSPPARTYNGVIAEIVAACCSRALAAEPLRILEIGAGTGSTTSHVLRRVQDLAPAGLDYTFTDVSPLFLKRAAEKFGNPAYMQFRLLDAGSDPASQGFEPGSFDIVISANALHATPDLDVTMTNVRALLKPGGLLVLLEGATPQRFGDVTVGLLDGWWAYSDTHRRNYALMPREPWLRLLAEKGFVDAVALPGEETKPVLSQQAVYIAQRPPDAATRAPSRFVIVPDRQGFALAVSQAIRAGGDVADIVSAGPALAANLRAALGARCDGVVFLLALDIAIADDMQAEAVLADQQGLLTSALTVVQTLASRHAASQRLWLVTRGGQAAADESANAAQATLWGFSHVVALEHPELSCTRVDLDIGASAAVSAAALVAEMRGAGLEDQIALRGGTRLVRRLVQRASRTQVGTPLLLPVAADKSYLITGGLRGLGLRVAEWLAEQGAMHLVLMGRSAPDDHALRAIERLEARGVKVVAARGDVGVRKDVERVIASIVGAGPRLAGVVHTAGVLDDGVLTSQNWSRFATVMASKVAGTWLLHTLARDLDFLVLFSSGASLAGSAGQSNHAAANAFEDAMAWYRQTRGLPTVSINWGPWGEIGAAADRHVGAPGLKPIAPADGLAALDCAMRGEGAGALFPTAQLAVFATDWSHLFGPEAASRMSPLFAELVAEAMRHASKGVGPAAGITAGPSLHERMQAAVPNRRKAVLRDFVRQQTVKVLGLSRSEVLDVNEPLRQLGLDSLMALELRNALGKAINRTLPATVTFDHPSVEALVDFLWTEIFADELDDVAQDAKSSPSEAFETMTEDELAHRLAARLESLGHR